MKTLVELGPIRIPGAREWDDLRRCNGTVLGSRRTGADRSSRCTYTGTVKINGGWWCKVHACKQRPEAAGGEE